MIIALLPFYGSGWAEVDVETSGGFKYLSVSSETDSLPVCAVLNAGSSISFREGEPVFHSLTDSLQLPATGRIKLKHFQRAPLWVKVETPHSDYSNFNLPASIKSIGADDTTSYLTDDEGLIYFEDLPPGRYQAEIKAENRGLEAPVRDFYHQISDTVTIVLDEFPVAPYGLEKHEHSFDPTWRTYSLTVRWQKPEELAPLPYDYLISLDGDDPIEFEGYDIIVENVYEGPHSLELWGVTPTGLETEHETIKFELVYNTSGVDSLMQGLEDSPSYFIDLKGLRVSPDNMEPGVYIKVIGDKSEKILIAK